MGEKGSAARAPKKVAGGEVYIDYRLRHSRYIQQYCTTKDGMPSNISICTCTCVSRPEVMGNYVVYANWLSHPSSDIVFYTTVDSA